VQKTRPIRFPDWSKDSPIVATFKFDEEEVTLRESQLRWLKEIDGQSWLEGIWELLHQTNGALKVLKSIEGAKRGLTILRERGESLDYGFELPSAVADFEAEFRVKLDELAGIEQAEYEARIEAEAAEVGLTEQEILEIAQKAAKSRRGQHGEKGYATYADFEPIIAERKGKVKTEKHDFKHYRPKA